MSKKVFIGSSKECLHVAEKIASWLEADGVIPCVWDRIDECGEYFLSTLEEVAESISGAVFVFNEDDTIWYRGDETTTVRDNVLFEYGLFLGKLSRKQVIIAYYKKPKLPTDLFGITLLKIQEGNEYSTKENFRKWVSKLPEVNNTVITYEEDMVKQQYSIVNEEIGYEYQDLTNGKYINGTTIRAHTKDLRYYTVRYAWAYGGEIVVSPFKNRDTLVDEFRDKKNTAYTLRLSRNLTINEVCDTGFVITTHTPKELGEMFVSNTFCNYHEGSFKLWVKIPESMKFLSVIYRKYEESEDLSPIQEEYIPFHDDTLYIEKELEGYFRRGESYYLHWVVAIRD